MGGPRHRRGVGRVHPGHGGAGRLRGVRCLRPPRPGQDRRAGAGGARRVLRPDHRGRGALGHGRRALLGRLEEAGGGGVPGPAAAQAVRRAGRPPHHGLGRPHPARRGRSGRRPPGPAGRGPASPGCRGSGGRRPVRGPGRPGRSAPDVATPAELAFERTNLDEVQLGHLQRLLGTWGILADLSFSDLVLLAPMAPDGARARRRRDGAGGPGPDAPVQQRHRGPARPGGPDGRRRPVARGRAHPASRAR